MISYLQTLVSELVTSEKAPVINLGKYVWSSMKMVIGTIFKPRGLGREGWRGRVIPCRGER